MEFSRYPFWVQIHGVPLKRLSSGNACLIGSKLCHVLEVDSSVDEDDGDFDFMRVQVEMDV